MGVPKKMPCIGHGWFGPDNKGIQRYRMQESYTMTDVLKSPFPWPGGKSDMAPAVWARFGQPENYVEPFCGSAAMLLGRPGGAHATETVNDIDGLLINAYRCIQFAPEETAEWCDWPVSEADLTSRHLHLKAARNELTARLFADPFYCDPLLGSWWLWGIASWIGDGWCVADGPWINVDGRLVDRRITGDDQTGISKRISYRSPNGQMNFNRKGVQAYRHHEGVKKQMPSMTAAEGRGTETYRASVPRKMPEIGRSPNGQIGFNRKGVQAYRHHEGVPKQMPSINAANAIRDKHIGGQEVRSGVQKFDDNSALAAYFARLSDRLRRVRFLCGDWQRAVKDSVTVNHGLTGVFLDPPYPQAEHDMAYHSEESGDVWHAAAAWSVERGDDPRLRICIAGYYSEATDALFPASWERVRWEARGGYANQKADGRGRANAKRECLWFSPHCLNPADEARAAFDKPITVRESDYTGTMFEEQCDD